MKPKKFPRYLIYILKIDKYTFRKEPIRMLSRVKYLFVWLLSNDLILNR